jgi:hypothetical protein
LQERLETAETQVVREREDRIEQLTQLQHEADENEQGRDAALEQIAVLERERDQIAAECRRVGFEARELESHLMARLAEAEAGAHESERQHLDEVARFSQELEQTQAREGASVRRLGELGVQVGELEATQERLRQDTEVEQQRFQASLTSLQDQRKQERKAWECELNAARQQHTLDLAAYREESDTFRRQVEELRHERHAALEKAEESGRETRALAEQIENARLAEAETERRHQTELARLTEELIQTREQQNASSHRSSEVFRQPSPVEFEPDQFRQAEDSINLDNQQCWEIQQDKHEPQVGAKICLGAIRSQIEERIRYDRRRAEELQHERRALLLQVQTLSRVDRRSDQDDAAEMSDLRYDLESVNEYSRNILAEMSRKPEHASHVATPQAPQVAPVGYDPQMIVVSDTVGISIDQCRPQDSISPPDRARSRVQHLDAVLNKDELLKQGIQLI